MAFLKRLSGTSRQPSDSIRADKVKRDESEIFLRHMYYVGLAGCVLILLYSMRFWNSGQLLRILGVGLLVAGAALLSGFLLGFIFAIPRVGNERGKATGSEDAYDAATESRSNSSLRNANLVEISDWLTKIIVGVGLVELRSIPGKLGLFSYYLAPALQATQCPGNACGVDPLITGQAAGMAIIIFYFTLGFLMGYVWTLIFLQKDLAEKLEDVKQLNATLEKKNKITEEQKRILALQNQVMLSDSYRWILQAENDLSLGKLDDALDAANTAIEKDPQSGGAVLTKARVLKRKASASAGPEKEALLKQALVLADQAIALLPGKGEALYNKACYLALLGMDKSDVLANLRSAFRLNPALRQVAIADADLAPLMEEPDFKYLIDESGRVDA